MSKKNEKFYCFSTVEMLTPNHKNRVTRLFIPTEQMFANIEKIRQMTYDEIKKKMENK